MKVRDQGGWRWVQNFVDEACRKYIFSSPDVLKWEERKRGKGKMIKKESESKEKHD